MTEDKERHKPTLSTNKKYVIARLGLPIYQLAKLRILEFYHDLDQKFLKDKHELLFMDTDTFY